MVIFPIFNFTLNSVSFSYQITSGTYTPPVTTLSFWDTNKLVIIITSSAGGTVLIIIIVAFYIVRWRRQRALKEGLTRKDSGGLFSFENRETKALNKINPDD